MDLDKKIKMDMFSEIVHLFFDLPYDFITTCRYNLVYFVLVIDGLLI